MRRRVERLSNDKNIPDLGEGSHVGYLCVERGDVADHALTLVSRRHLRSGSG